MSMRVLTTEGEKWLDGLSWQETSDVGRHWNAVQKVLETGDEEPLRNMWGVTVGGFPLETDAMVIYVLGHRGELNFDDLYGEGGEW